jgi:hypothetical protein
MRVVPDNARRTEDGDGDRESEVRTSKEISFVHTWPK